MVDVTYQDIKSAQRQYMREWRLKNADHLKKYQREWRKRNPDKVMEYKLRFWTRQADKLKQKGGNI